MKWHSPFLIIPLAFAIILLVGLGFYKNQNLASQKPTPQAINQIISTPTVSDTSVSITTPSQKNTFNHSAILKKFAFIDSKGKNKLLIVLKTEEEHSGTPVVDTYITDEDLLKISAVKISVLSGKDSVLNYHITDPQSVLISISPGTEKKFIVVSSSGSGEDSGFMTLVDENGRVISEEVVDEVFPLLKNKCQCSFKFGAWKEKNKFYVVIHTYQGTYRVLIDANTGKPIGIAEEIK